MKKSDVLGAYQALATIDVAKVKDKKFRNALISDYLMLCNEKKAIQKDLKALQEKLPGQAGQPSQAFNDAADEYLNGDCEAKFVQVSRERLLEEASEQHFALTLNTLSVLNDILTN